MTRNTTLLATLCYPPHNIPLGELVRIKWNCTLPDTYLVQQREVCSRLKTCHWPQWSLARAVNRVAVINRSDLLMERWNNQICNPNSARIVFSTAYSPQFQQIISIIKKYFSLLMVNEKMNTILGTGVRFVSCRAPTIGLLISPSVYVRHDCNHNWLTTAGVYGCGHARCTACKFTRNTKSFTSSSNGSSHCIRSYMKCNSMFGIYVITLTSCKIIVRWVYYHTIVQVHIRRQFSRC